MKFTREHLVVGIAPYIDTSSGDTRASYQLLGSEGKAIATVEVKNGKVIGSRATAEADLGLLCMFAVNAFSKAVRSGEALRFDTAVA